MTRPRPELGCHVAGENQVFLVPFATDIRDFYILQKLANRLRGPPNILIIGYRGLLVHGLWCEADY